MQTPPQLRFLANLQTFQVLDTQTGEVHQFESYEAAWLGRSRLEVAARPAAKTGTKMQKRQERKEGGQRV